MKDCLEWMRDMGYAQVIIETDCQAVTKGLSSMDRDYTVFCQPANVMNGFYLSQNKSLSTESYN